MRLKMPFWSDEVRTIFLENEANPNKLFKLKVCDGEHFEKEF